MQTKKLKLLETTSEGVGIGAEYVNDIIARIEDLVDIAIKSRPIAGNNISIQFTNSGAIISATPINTTT